MNWSFTPNYIRQTEAQVALGTVTAARWNELWNLNITQGDHSEITLNALINTSLPAFEAELKAYTDTLEGELATTAGASKIGINAITGVMGTTVQAVAAGLKSLIDTCYKTTDATAALALKESVADANALVKTVSFDAATGTFVFTHQSGSTTVIDTNFEKAVVNFSYDTANQRLVLVDTVGNTSYISLSAFITETEFVDSAQLDFSVNSHSVTATIKSGSITDAMLSSALITTLQGYVSSANTAATNAAASEANASTYKTNAANSAAAASNSATTAANSASSASGSASSAASSAGTATQKATAASDSAAAAAASESNAHTSEVNAAASADAANTKASAAAVSATNAKTSETNAKTSETNAAASAAHAQQIETDAESAENTRISNENTRQSNESTRTTNENGRVSAESARAFIEDYNANTSYVVGNKAALNGNTYQCKSPCKGITPPNTTYWILISSKGDSGVYVGSGEMPEGYNVQIDPNGGDFSLGALITSGAGYAIDNGSTRPTLGDKAVDESYTTNNTYGATGKYSHAECENTTASGLAAHAEGLGTTASGLAAHAEGLGTTASCEAQHVSGRANLIDTTSLEIVGNGTVDVNTGEALVSSNARTLDASGNGWFAGKVSAGTEEEPATPTAANDLTPKQYVDASISELSTKVLEKTSYGVYTGLGVTAQSTPNMTVSVATGTIYMANGDRFTPAANTALAVTAADATNPRIDIVYVNSSGVIAYLAGTAAASPAAPSVPTGGQKLAEISVAAGATTIVAANIADRRKNLRTEAWITPTLINGWTVINDNYIKYMKDADGFVHIRGEVTGGSAITVFTLPSGYRPWTRTMFVKPASVGTASYSNIAVQAIGNVDITFGATSLLGEIVFRAEQ